MANNAETRTPSTGHNSSSEYSKDEIQGMAEEMSFQELSSLAHTDPKMLDIFLSAVVAEEQADIATSKNDKAKNTFDEARGRSEELWSVVEQKKKIVSHIIVVSKKAIGEAIKNMEALEQVRNSTEEQMNFEVQFATEAKQNAEADLRRANEIMAMAEIRAEKAAEALKKALEERDAANCEVQKAKGLIKGADFQLKVNEDHVMAKKQKAEEKIGVADLALKEAIENSFKLEVKSAAEIEEAKDEKTKAEMEATEYNEVLESATTAYTLAYNVAKRATAYRQQVMVEACTVAARLKNKDDQLTIAEEMLVETQQDKKAAAADTTSVASSKPQIEDDIDGGCHPLEENEVMASLLARLDAINQLNPANE